MARNSSDSNSNAYPPWGLFPPWGFLNNDDASAAGPLALRPDAWDQNQAQFEVWFKDTLELINELLWPSFDFQSRSWKPAASVSTMEALTRQDLTLLRGIYAGFPKVFESPVRSPIGILGRRTQRELFKIEDLSVSAWGTYYACYDNGFKDSEIANFTSVMGDALTTRAAGVDLSFKRQLQRPRPWQTALLLGG